VQCTEHRRIGSAPFRLIPIRLIPFRLIPFPNPNPNPIPNPIPIPNSNPNHIPNPHPNSILGTMGLGEMGGHRRIADVVPFLTLKRSDSSSAGRKRILS